VRCVSGWLGRAARRGILTTHYPSTGATDDEVPPTGRAPRSVDGRPPSDSAIAGCPVRAISAAGVDPGRCIRCARCLAHGLEFRGPIESALPTRAVSDPPAGAPLPTGAPLRGLGRSLHVFLVDVGSCQACNLEVLGLAHPQYDASRLGIFFTNSPRHADVLLVVGVPTAAMTEPLRRTYEAMPAPKAVIAIGACAIGGGVFAGGPDLAESVDRIVPVDLYVPGCPPPPIEILDALLRLIGRSRTEGGP